MVCSIFMILPSNTKENPITNKVPPPKKNRLSYPPAIGGIITITSPSLS